MKVDDLYEKNNKELRALSKLKLPISKSIQKLILSQELNSHTKYFSIIQLWRGKIIERIFAARNKKIPEFQEVIRRIEGNKNCIVRNMYYGFVCGYKIVWKDSKPSYYYFDKKTDMDKWYIYDKSYYQIETTRLYSIQDVIELDPSLKYCAWNGKVHLMNWITIYRKFPEIEMLSKLNLEYLISNYKILETLKDRKFKKFLVNNNAIHIKGLNFNSNDILYCCRHNVSLEERVLNKEINKQVKMVVSTYEEIDKAKLFNYFKKYAIKNNHLINVSSYYDLLRAERYLDLDLILEKNAFPHDFDYWHDFYTKQIEAIKSQGIDKRMLEQSIKYKKLAKEIDGLKLILPTCTQDLIDEGKALNHCVGRMGYNRKIADNESLILFVREEENTPLYTMEYDHHKKKILQFYGCDDRPVPDEVRTIIETKWLPKVRMI